MTILPLISRKSGELNVRKFHGEFIRVRGVIVMNSRTKMEFPRKSKGKIGKKVII